MTGIILTDSLDEFPRKIDQDLSWSLDLHFWFTTEFLINPPIIAILTNRCLFELKVKLQYSFSVVINSNIEGIYLGLHLGSKKKLKLSIFS